MEKPNLSYIKDLSGGEAHFEAKLIGIIKEEFPREKSIYFKNLDAKNYSKAADDAVSAILAWKEWIEEFGPK